MNNYPEWWNQTITIYNRYEEPSSRRISWYKNIVSGCFWKDIGNQIVLGETVVDTNSTLCRIPIQENFIHKYLWNDLDSNSKAQKFTLGVGDIVVLGEVSDNIDEYSSGTRSSDFLSKYKKLQGCMVIERVSINVGGGRGTEHYLVKGV